MNALCPTYLASEQRDGLNDLLMSLPALLFYVLGIITSSFFFYFKVSPVSAICFSFEVVILNFWHNETTWKLKCYRHTTNIDKKAKPFSKK